MPGTDVLDDPFVSTAIRDIVFLFALTIPFVALGRLMLEMKRRGSGFRGLVSDFFTPSVLADLLAVSLIFALPYAYSAFAVWRETRSGFIVISAMIVMFQMGLASEAYANVALARKERSEGENNGK